MTSTCIIIVVDLFQSTRTPNDVMIIFFIRNNALFLVFVAHKALHNYYDVINFLVINFRIYLSFQGKMQVFHLAVIVTLLLVTFILGELWMSLTRYNYARLHLFLFAPMAFLYFIPPHVANTTVRRNGYFTMAALAVTAVVFSALTWDQILWSTETVFVVDRKDVFGYYLSIPYEEYLWCANHSIIIGLWMLSTWKTRPVSKTPGNGRWWFRSAVCVACLAIGYYGYCLTQGDQKYYYLGIVLLYTFPIIGLQAACCGHMYFHCLPELLSGIIVPSVYVVAIDAWALYRNIWSFSDERTSGIYLCGMLLEQSLVYVLTTILVVQGMLAIMRETEVYLAIRPKMGSALEAFNKTHVW